MTSETKVCTQCQEPYPATPEFFHRNKDGVQGLASQCKQCRKSNAAADYSQDPAKYLARNRRWSEENRDKKLEINRRWNQANSEHQNEASRQWRLAYPERRAAAIKNWNNRNREKRRAGFHRYYARKRSLPSTFTPEQWKLCLEWWNNTCAYCGSQQDFWHVIEQDHFVPIVSGGGYTADNIIPACRVCNGSKNANPAPQWLASKFKTRRAKEILAKIQSYFEYVQTEVNSDGHGVANS